MPGKLPRKDVVCSNMVAATNIGKMMGNGWVNEKLPLWITFFFVRSPVWLLEFQPLVAHISMFGLVQP